MMVTGYPVLLGRLKDLLLEEEAKGKHICRPASRDEILQACVAGFIESGYPESRAKEICEARLKTIDDHHKVAGYELCSGTTETGIEQAGFLIKPLRDYGGELGGTPSTLYPQLMVHVHPANVEGLSPADVAYALRKSREGAAGVCVIDREHRDSNHRMQCVISPKIERSDEEIEKWAEAYQDCIDNAYETGTVVVQYYVDMDYLSLKPSKKVRRALKQCAIEHIIKKQDEEKFVVLYV